MKRSGLAAALLVVFFTGVADAAPVVEVEIPRDRVETVLGDTVQLDVLLRNASDRPTGPLLGHLVVVDPMADGSADAEDWTRTLTRPIEGVGPGDSSSVTWDITPISAGRFFVMVVVVPEEPDLEPGVSSNVVVDVAESEESLQASVLPIAIAGPLVVGGLLWALLRRERRRVDRLAPAI